VFYILAENAAGEAKLFVTYDGFCSCSLYDENMPIDTATSISSCPNRPNTIAIGGVLNGLPTVITS
jgi:hypothetical protein